MYDIYTIENGDTIETIARKYNTSPSVLYQINNLTSGSFLTPGTTLIVPKKSSNYFEYYNVQTGDTLFGIARNNNVDYKLLAMINGLDVNDYIYPNQTIMIPKRGVSFYVTKEGDTLNNVLDNFKTDINNLIRQNSRIYLLPEQLIVYKQN